MDFTDSIKASLSEARDVLDEFMSGTGNIQAIGSAAGILVEAVGSGKKILACGNGGSMTDAMHFAEEMSGVFREKRKAFPAIAISDPSHITCTANDYGFDAVFSRYVEAIGQTGDVLLAITTSGNSMNIIRAAEAARDKGMKVVGLTGRSGGLLAGIADCEICVRGRKYSDRIQEVHIKVLHILVQLVEQSLGQP
ncbi:MAG: D-sedoheptulose 7-phosphate isomerase [Bacteroidetes bacterium]|nr:MAG: D-sedoheptulose 7-phosphate isomerase [Bacteroidota bacterium]